MMKTLTITLISIAVLVGCDSANHNEEREAGPHTFTPTAPSNPGNPKTLREKLEQSGFYCEKSKDCPPNVGLLMANTMPDSFSKYSKLSQCSAFLIADDIIATNSHCIPDLIKTSHDCGAQLAVKFITDPEGLQQGRVFSCKEILSYSSLKEFDQDYAFIRIEPTGIKPLLIDKSGIKDNEKIRVFKVDPTSENDGGGTLLARDCKIALNSMLGIKGSNSWSKVGAAIGCKTVHGNSGSPFLNEKGEVVGIVQSFATEKFKDYLDEAFGALGLEMPPRIPDHFQFTSFSCVNDPVNGDPNKERCEHGDKLGISDCVKFDLEKSKEASRRFNEEKQKGLPEIFVYGYMSKEGLNYTTISPVCVKTRKQLANFDKFVTTQKRSFGREDQQISIMSMSGFTTRVVNGLDEDFRINSAAIMEIDEIKNEQFNLERDGELWKGTRNEVSVGYTYDRKSSPNLYKNLYQRPTEVLLPSCTDEMINMPAIDQTITAENKVVDTKEVEKTLLDKIAARPACEM